jgi:hypothetical protein
MNPQEAFCPNMACPARGQLGQGNVIGHGRTRRRYRCTVCRKTFSPRTGTLFHRRHTAIRLMVQIITLVSYGCPLAAIWPFSSTRIWSAGAWLQHRLAYGTVRDFLTGLWSTPGCQVLNTAFIERLNATFRARLAPLVRRTRALARLPETLTHGMQLVGACYNFCTLHTSLTTADGMRQTPAMAAGITDHWWSMSELLSYRVPPPRWEPPRRRGRRSRELQALIDRWAPTYH